MFYNSQVLKAGLAATALLEVATQAQTATQRTTYANFNEVMVSMGDNYGWDSYEVTTEDGYVLTMFRITEGTAAVNQIYTDDKGPILLYPGMYSEIADWFVKDDLLASSTPVQLADLGFDVWFGVPRGREYSRAHTTLDADIDDAYWNYSFEEMGFYDIPAMVDTIRDNRLGSCSRVAVVGHSSGANATLVAALNPALSDKVSRIVNMAPCLNVNFDEFWMDQRDIASVSMLYSYFTLNGICSFDTASIDTMEAFCANLNNIGLVTYVCNNFIEPAFTNPDIKEPSLKAFQHVHENTVACQF